GLPAAPDPIGENLMQVHGTGHLFTILTQTEFPLGIITLMTDAEFCLRDESVGAGLLWHARGYWGKVDEELQRSNDEALESGGPVMSLFISEPLKIPFRIITDGDRRNTFVMLDSEYPDFAAGDVGPLFGDKG